MAACMLPTAAFAAGAENDKAIQLVDSGTAANISGGQNDNIYFGTWDEEPIKWRVLDDQTNTGESGLFLLSDALLGTGRYGDVYFDNSGNTSNAWQSSTAKTWCNNFYGSSFSNGEQGAVLATTKSDEALSTGGISFAASENILNGDKVFFLSAEEAENSAYGFTDDNARIANYGNSAGVWWLRSPYAIFTTYAGVVFGDGPVYAYVVSGVWAARPAFNLNLGSVLFTSAAVDGKPDGGLTPISEYTGSEWKLTLLDNSRNFAVTEKAVSAAPDGTLTLHYSGATTGANEYISVILADNSGAKYYGRVAQPTAESGTVEIKIPSDIAPGDYTLKVFNEQYNGDYNTDYASNFTDIALTVENQPDEQFTLASDGRYYFDLSTMNIPGTANSGNSFGAVSLPDTSLHYVPFTYAGTIEAYKLTSAMATTEEYAQQNKYAHSLFVADYAVTHTVSWDDLNTKGLIFGKNYASGGVDYTMRAPSAGSQSNNNNGKDDSSTRGIPKSNEWDAILDKANQDWKDNTSGYIKNWSRKYSFGQDNHADASIRAVRGHGSARYWRSYYASYSLLFVGFRPVLEILNADTLDSDGLKVVTLDLNGGKLGGSSDAIHIIVKNGSKFTAPASNGLTRPAGNTGSYFMWLGSDGKLYAPGDNVPADVTKLTAQFALSEQFSLKPGDTYYFDLSAMNIPGTANGGNSDGAVSLPDTSLHYVPFTYVGTIEAYKLTSATATTEEYAQQNKYPHSLFVADYAVTHTISWGGLNDEGLIFGKNYASGGVDYTLRAPSVGSISTGSGDSQRGVPQSNEWDRMLDKDEGHIKNWSNMYSWGQDASNSQSGTVAVCGNSSARYRNVITATNSYSILGFRPVLEVMNPDTVGSDGLKVVTLALGGGKLGGSTDTIRIIVKSGSKFTAPASDGLNRPDGNTGRYFKWLGSDGNLYAPGESVPEVVTTLTAQWTVNQYTITYDLAGGTVEGNPDTYTIETVAFTLKNPTKSGYTFTGWSGTGLDGENNMTVTIPKGSTGNRSYTAHWRYNGGGGSGYSYYTIKATAGAGGSISPSGNVSVREGRDQTFTITPDKGYAVANVKIDGKSIGAVKSYTFENVSRTHTIEVIFMKANGNPQTGVFVDVATGSYYEDAVDWAVENGITKGTDDTHFSPDGICTRAQAVTFLWRTAGSPKPETRAMPFTDVPVGSYYYDAVLWAVENGITKGTSDTTFSPNMTCSRAQIITFLWRSEKSPAAGTANPFADVKSTAYYADAVLWAVKENITKGTTSTTFSPNADCTRAQIVTFLWRCKK